MTFREVFEANAKTYMMVGDLDKPFHLPECECHTCEEWRKDNDRPTHEELRRKQDANTGTQGRREDHGGR